MMEDEIDELLTLIKHPKSINGNYRYVTKKIRIKKNKTMKYT